MSPKRNELEIAAERVAQGIIGMGPSPGQPLAVPFGLERLEARDHANRLFGPSSSPALRKVELERLGTAEMMKLAQTYQKQHKGRNLLPLKGGV